MNKNSLWNRMGRVRKTIAGSLIALQALTLFSLTAVPGNTAVAAEPAVVSTWMWNPYLIQNKEATLTQLKEHEVNRVYLFIDPTYSATYYRSFIKEAKANSIDVFALSGAPNWVLPEHNKKMYEFIYWVKQYNSSALPEEQFAGIHLDVEPYVLPQWSQDSDTVIGLWMDTVSGFVEEVKSDTNLTVGMDMPVWLNYTSVRDGFGGRTTLSDWFINRVDQVTLMAYVDNAKGITESVQQEMAEADRAGVPVLVAVETVDNDEAGTSFYDLGNQFMLTELNSVVQTLSSHSSFKGYNVHEWDSWIKLKP